MKQDIKHLLYGMILSLFVWVFGGILAVHLTFLGYNILAIIIGILTIFFGSYGLILFY